MDIDTIVKLIVILIGIGVIIYYNYFKEGDGDD